MEMSRVTAERSGLPRRWPMELCGSSAASVRLPDQVEEGRALAAVGGALVDIQSSGIGGVVLHDDADAAF